jgi:hypothetical protein
LALGRAVRNILDRFVRTGLGRKHSGFRLARLLPKLLASHLSRIQLELTPEISSRIPLVRPSSAGLEDASLDTIKDVVMTLSGSLGCPLLPETSFQKVPITTLEVEKLMGKNGDELEGFDGISRGLRKAREELAPGVPPVLSSSRGGSSSSPDIGSAVGSLERMVLPTLSLEDPRSKSLIQYKRKGRKPKSAVGQGEHKDAGFLRRGFLKSSSSSRPKADRGFSGQGCSSPSRARLLNFVEWALFCSSMGIEKGQEVNTVAYLSALDEEHRRWDKIEDCEF